MDEDPSTGPIYGMEYDLETGVLVYVDRADKSLWRVPLQRIIMATDLREVGCVLSEGLCTYSCTRKHTHTYTHTYIYTHMHARTHTHYDPLVFILLMITENC